MNTIPYNEWQYSPLQIFLKVLIFNLASGIWIYIIYKNLVQLMDKVKLFQSIVLCMQKT